MNSVHTNYDSIWDKLKAHIPEIILLGLFCIVQIPRLNADFWNDEIYTLKHFVFTSFYTTITDYHVPNNHILFNLINNIYLKIVSVDSLHALMDASIKIRILPFIYSILTVLFTYLIGKKHFNRPIALIGVLVLMTTIPYYNFALQIRGYGLSTLFLSGIIYYCLHYLKTFEKKYLFIIIGLIIGIIYTLPSNIYAVFSLGVIIVVFFLSAFYGWKNFFTGVDIFPTQTKGLGVLAVVLLLGTLISIGLYSPIFADVFRNEYVKAGTPFQPMKLIRYTWHIGYGVISGRYLLVGLALLGFIKNIEVYRKWISQIILFGGICLIPVLIVFIRGDDAPLRIFIPYMPIYALLASMGLYSFYKLFESKKTSGATWFVALFIYSALVFGYELSKINKQLLDNIKEGGRSQNLYYQYYAARYQPREDLKKFEKLYSKETYPIIILGCEPHGIPNYLDKLQLPYLEAASLDSLSENAQKFYAITNHPFKYLQNPNFKVEQMNSELTYHNILLFERKD